MEAGYEEPSDTQVPALSVIIACLNAEDVLNDQLTALAGQVCPVPWELLICDNGSTDGTVALAERWADRLPLRVLDASAVHGSGPARNAGAAAASGEWLGFCDADDEVGPGWLAALCRALTDHVMVAGPFEDARLNSDRVRRSRPNSQQHGLQYLTPGIGLPHAGAGNLGIRRAVFLEVGGFDPEVRYLQDTDLCWRIQLAGHDLTFVPDMLVHVRLRSTFRGMYRQGRNFGVSQAILEHRYADTARELAAGRSGALDREGPDTADAAAGTAAAGTAASPGTAADAEGLPDRPRTGVLRRGARLATWVLRNRVGLGGQVWQLGWHLGHRHAGIV
jgi:glycosyltransferase involved in cell wall biosynthesis